MKNIRTENVDGLLVVTMSRGAANPMNAEMIAELHEALALARAADVRGLVLASDRPKFFSAGFDVKEVFQYGREEMRDYFGSFMDLYEGLFRLLKPVVGAISGHSVAGGSVLALTCDERVMADGPFQFALNEVNLGVVLPPGLVRMAVDAIGVHEARVLFLGGEPLTPQRALAIGLASELAPPEKVLERAVARARALSEKPAGAFRAIKRTLIDVAGHDAGGADRRHLDRFVEHWFSAESVARRQALTEKLRS
jgi:enoyl-CoA hydratase/carnithine racemase